MSVFAASPGFWDLVESSATLDRLGTGFTFTEGPVWHPRDGFLLFSDMPGDVLRRWDEDGTIREVRRPSNKCNGHTYDADLNLITCEHATSCLVREWSDGGRQVLASHFEGRALNSPNDVCVRADGSIYFSDPWYGRMPGFGVERPRDLGWQGVFRVPPEGGEPQLLVDRDAFEQPNGLCFSPDERLLYINDTPRASIRVHDVRADGSLDRGRLFADGLTSSREPGAPDGMKCDEHGNVWVTGPGGIWVLNPSGHHLGTVHVPEVVGNLAWGGRDWRTLFITASTSLYSLRTRVGPHRESYMTTGHGSRTPQARRPPPVAAQTAPAASGLGLDPRRCALIIQDMQNDVVSEGGAFAASGAPLHAAQQNVVANLRRLAAACRAKDVPVIHVWFIVEPGAPGLTLNAPLFRGLAESGGVVRGTWGAAPAAGLEPIEDDFVVEKMRMSPWEGSRLETILRGLGRDTIINAGAWTNMAVEHTARTGADKGFTIVMPEDGCSTMNAEWQRAAFDFALKNVATITTVDAIIAALAR